MVLVNKWASYGNITNQFIMAMKHRERKLIIIMRYNMFQETIRKGGVLRNKTITKTSKTTNNLNNKTNQRSGWVEWWQMWQQSRRIRRQTTMTMWTIIRPKWVGATLLPTPSQYPEDEWSLALSASSSIPH